MSKRRTAHTKFTLRRDDATVREYAMGETIDAQDAEHWFAIAHSQEGALVSGDDRPDDSIDDMNKKEVSAALEARGVTFDHDSRVGELRDALRADYTAKGEAIPPTAASDKGATGSGLKPAGKADKADKAPVKNTAKPDPKPADAGSGAQGDPQRGGLEHPVPAAAADLAAGQGSGVMPLGSDNVGDLGAGSGPAADPK